MLVQTVEKARCAIFSAEGLHRLPTRLTARRAANGVRKALLRKAAEPTAHVAGFGTRIRGLRPSDTSQGFIDKLNEHPAYAGCSSFLVVGSFLTV